MNNKAVVRSLALAAVFGLSIALSACGGSSAPAQRGSGSESQIKNSISQNQTSTQGGATVSFSAPHYPANWTAIPTLIAVNQGFVEKQGLKVGQVVSSSGGGADLRNVVQGGIPFADISLGSIIQAWQQTGDPGVVIIAGSEQHATITHWVTMPNSPYSTLHQIIDAGQSIAVTQHAGSFEQSLAVMTHAWGYDWNKVHVVAAGELTNGLTLLKTGKVGAAVIMDPQYSMQAKQWKDLPDAREFTNDPSNWTAATVLVTSKQMVQDHPDVVQKVVNAWIDTMNFMNQNPEKATQLYYQAAKLSGPGLPSTLMDGNGRTFDYRLRPEGFKTMVEGMVLTKVVNPDAKIPWDKLIDQQFLPSDVRVDVAQFPQPSQALK